ncbi:MAG: HAMP domain-containing histidine kinase, partial [Deltaproteobacteria bacterium]|nr:HAMP domain-containing histidine kinase [Deltaproteobacteria bacterium]
AIARLIERAMTDNILLQEALFASMGRLYMTMGHEIRDAVTGVKDLPEKLRQDIDALQIEDIKSKEQGKKIEDMRRTVDGLEKAGERILNLFDFCTDLSREDPIPQHISLRRLLDEVADDMKRRHCSQETIFKVEVEDVEPLIIEGSRIKLRQVLRNLVLNACQQMETSDTLCPYIEMRAFLDKGNLACPVKIMISDSGPGIHTKDWEKIFEPWQSTRKKGAGLGLFICRLLIRAMGGNIRIYESFRFIGTTFIIELPREMSNDRS